MEGADIRSSPERRDIMSNATRSPDIRPKAPRIVLAILCVVALSGLTQCKMTADKVTGVSTTMDKAQLNRGSCVSECAHDANDAMDVEKDLHKQNVQDCHGDQACLDAEQARHNAAVDVVQENRKHCMDGCHHQGGGHGR
jgi:hypothetical protein